MADRDAILAVLRAALRVSISVDQRTAFGPREELSVTVHLYLGDDIISTDTAATTPPSAP